MSANLARGAAGAAGPLSSSISQWGLLGLLGIQSFQSNSESSIKDSLANFLKFLLSALTDNRTAISNAGQQQQPPSIIIHNPSSASGKSQLSTALLLGCSMWGTYSLLQYSPTLNNLLPVTKSFFKSSVTALGRTIINVRDTLSSKIASLTTKVDALSSTADSTNSLVSQIQETQANLSSDVSNMKDTLERCESSLSDSLLQQGYAVRGVRLLAAYVCSMLPDTSGLKNDLKGFVTDHDVGAGGGRENNPEIMQPKTPERNEDKDEVRRIMKLIGCGEGA